MVKYLQHCIISHFVSAGRSWFTSCDVRIGAKFKLYGDFILLKNDVLQFKNLETPICKSSWTLIRNLYLTRIWRIEDKRLIISWRFQTLRVAIFIPNNVRVMIKCHCSLQLGGNRVNIWHHINGFMINGGTKMGPVVALTQNLSVLIKMWMSKNEANLSRRINKILRLPHRTQTVAIVVAKHPPFKFIHPQT